MSEDSDIRYVVDTLYEVKRRQAQRLTRGLALREIVHKEIARGIGDHYRAKWLRASVLEVFDALKKIAMEFNREHEDDLATLQDLGDILSSALATLRDDDKDESFT